MYSRLNEILCEFKEQARACPSGEKCGLILRTILPALVLLLTGCPQLPDYALPHIGERNSDRIFLTQVFTYRALTLDDFQAASLPEHLADYADNLNAHSRLQIRPTKESKFIVTSNWYNNQLIYFGRIESIGFEAVMLPYLSWWNPHVSKEKTGYVLQHEQIHFALMELAAWELTTQAQERIKNLLVIESTGKAARDELMAVVTAMIEEKNEEILKQHTEFDQETSLYFDPVTQQRWFENVTQQLREIPPRVRADQAQ